MTVPRGTNGNGRMPDENGLTPDVRVKFTVRDVVIGGGTAVGLVLGALGYFNDMKNEIRSSNSKLENLQIQVGEQARQIKDRLDNMDLAVKERDKALEGRLADWKPWRWNVTHDIVTIARKTNAEIWTREEK